MKDILKKMYSSVKKDLIYPILIAGTFATSCKTLSPVVDDIYYSPNQDEKKEECVLKDSLENKINNADTLEIRTLHDLNYIVLNGGDANDYWRWRFVNSPYSSSLGWDFDGDGIVNAFDPNPYHYDFFIDSNLNGIPDDMEFGFWTTNLESNFFWLNYSRPFYLWSNNFYYYNYEIENNFRYGRRPSSVVNFQEIKNRDSEIKRETRTRQQIENQYEPRRPQARDRKPRVRDSSRTSEAIRSRDNSNVQVRGSQREGVSQSQGSFNRQKVSGTSSRTSNSSSGRGSSSQSSATQRRR